MGLVRDSLPLVPEDKEIRAKNRARNEEQKKNKEDKKAKAARKAQRREISAKNHREAEKAGVTPPDSPETSVSKIEGGGSNVDWLDELAEEDDVVPPAGGGMEILEGSKARGGSKAPEGSQASGGGQSTPHIVVDDEDGAPREGPVSAVPQEGEMASGGVSEVPLSRKRQRIQQSPAQRPEWRQATRRKHHGPRPPSKSLRHQLGRRGSGQWPLALRGAFKELRSPRRRPLPEPGACRASDLPVDFLFFSFF